MAIYLNPEAWRLNDVSWRAALRLESERDYLSRMLGEYQVIDLLREKTGMGEKTFALLGVPNTYTDRPIVDWWESALADRVLDTLKIHTMPSWMLMNPVKRRRRCRRYLLHFVSGWSI